MKCVYWKVSVFLKCVFTSRIDFSLNLVPLYTIVSKNTVSVSDISAVNLNPNPNSMFRDSHQNLTAQSTRRPQGALKEGFKFQRRDCKLSLIAAPLESPGELACKLFLSSSVTEFICLYQNEIVHILPYCGPS